MAVEQRPIVRDSDHDKSAYAAFAAAQFRILKDYMKVAKLNTYSRVVTLANGVVITCQKSFNREDIFISVPTGGITPKYTEDIAYEGFIFHPRSGGIVIEHYYIYATDEYGGIITTTGSSYGVAGGWGDGSLELATNYIFPLVDEDRASFVLGSALTTKKKDGVVESITSADNCVFDSTGYYGNLYWCNDATYDSGKLAWDKPFRSLSWRGSPTRHGRVPSNYNIPGLSLLESVHSSLFADEEEYTTFGTLLYSGGNASQTSPRFSWPAGSVLDRCLILGAAQNAGGATFIVTQNDHYNAPKYAWYLSNGEFLSGEADSVLNDRLSELNSTVPPPIQYVVLKKRLELTKPGFFIGVWSNKLSGNAAIVRDGWEMLYEGTHTRVGLPWFGNASGDSFVCGNGDQLDIDGFSVTYTPYTQPAGSTTQTLAGDVRFDVYHAMSASNQKYFYEYAADTKVSGVASLGVTSISHSQVGKWGDPAISYPDAQPAELFSNFVNTYTDTSVDSFGASEYCYTPTPGYTNDDIANLWHAPGYNTLQPNELSSSGQACIGTTYLGGYTGVGTMHTTRSQGSLVQWEGELPGWSHVISTNFTINVCGTDIPINKTERSFSIERTPWITNDPAIKPYQKCWVSEDCVSEKSTIHFLDERYGVCLYKTTRSEIKMPRKQNDELVTYIAYTTGVSSSVVIIRPSDYTATETETWYLVVDGARTVVTESVLEIFPFGEPMHNDYYEDVCEVLCFPRIPPSSSLYRSEDMPPGQTSAAGDFGTYEDAYGDPFGEQAQLDGGTDYFYPEWCRHLPEDPFWREIADSRFGFTAPAATTEAYGTGAYTAPAIVVEAIPIGSFARHPMLGDMYQFLINKFDGNNLVIGSASINDKIDEELAKAKDVDGISLGLVTHDTTLYYPISIL